MELGVGFTFSDMAKKKKAIVSTEPTNYPKRQVDAFGNIGGKKAAFSVAVLR